MKYSVEQLAYLAAIVDANATFSISKNKRGFYSCRTRIFSTRKNVLTYLKNTFGGDLYAEKCNLNDMNFPPRKNTIYEWQPTMLTMLEVFRKIEPFLVERKEHVRNIIEFRKTFLDKRGLYISEEIIEIREDLFHKMRELNKSKKRNC